MKLSRPAHIHAYPRDKGKTGAGRQRSSTKSALQTIPEEPVLVRVGGRVFMLTPKALRTYASEYGFDGDMPFDLDACMSHIEMEFEEALKGEAKPAYTSSKMIALESPSLVFKMVGS